MSINRREFLQTLAVASAGGLSLHSNPSMAQAAANKFYDLPKYGNVHLLHFTDCHAQLQPIYFREPNVNLGIGSQAGKTPHLVGEYFLKANGIPAGTRDAHAFTYLNFTEAAKTYGQVGGFAHLATLVKQIKASRPGSLLLDGGDTWQGSGTALWTNGQDMANAALALGVDLMTAHWEMTLGEDRVMEIVNKDFKGKIEFLAQNIKTADFGDPVFPSYSIRNMNGIPVAIIGQAFPYTPIANPGYFVPNWTFGIQEENLQKTIDEVKAKGAKVVVLLSHNGMDVDLKLASRVRGLHAILGGHTHDGVPIPVKVQNAGGTTLVTNAGSNGKYLAVLDFDVKGGKPVDFRYKLMPVFSNLIPADQSMAALIQNIRKPYESRLQEVLATTDALLYRRGNFNGSFDQVILDGLMAQKNAEIAFSPGFRWGTTLLPGQNITMENLLDQTAITYPYTTVNAMTGNTIKTILEDVADNLFNPDPYYQQGGDMVRVGGLQYTIDPAASMGKRITEMRLNGKLLDADKVYKVAGWAPVSEAAKNTGGEPIWDVIARHLREIKTVKAVQLNEPAIIGVSGNPGIAPISI
ncbi:thiosulfohydrolase SoxB [Polynucleobacter paneuropaeus]|uniref:Thiosulfohydrolase SoxB n=1 Tax=Polynucleobacter paneuropaeus TaxID=2527775 RepID=A0A9Q7CUR8_9BURK|nr:thiosulfohydrolase SoxB [Polynucleobacter paneuropaeus]MBT8518347.1 thiosulfohydrolase SoxB [Polynucleobacter paneuropaeus]MBT8531374.1 thiosulfohydrolase SoxB [Polynucleobacter paneuropaeus]MBT8550757.1 thiosulfohydrolase SoxB [Polynucleobacter paneuropaeus]MBT8579047.1 thiosulfohydrolase SoxB [Polynucleobacter paneuropaeus]MBT8585168.1 thiosulfohydrolase SoxB [Polynucleobacter paneuropaeus]